MSTDNNLLLDYIEFVDEVSSDATKHTDDFIDSIEVVEEPIRVYSSFVRGYRKMMVKITSL